MKKEKLLILFLFFYTITLSQKKDKQTESFYSDKFWPASWITTPDNDLKAFGVYHFRKKINLEKKPEHFIIHVSADNRYKLFINETEVVHGPARGDLENWFYETVDLAPFLHKGENIIAAVVWNYGQYKGAAQISLRTAFILQGHTESEAIANTNASWKIFKDESYSPLPYDRNRAGLYLDVGPGEQVDATKYPWNWAALIFNDSLWQPSLVLSRGSPKGIHLGGEPFLVPRTIPLMNIEPQRIIKVALTKGVNEDDGFIKGTAPLIIPSHTNAIILLDQTYLIAAYSEIKISGGRNSSVTILYSEAMYDSSSIRKGAKGNRNEIKGKEILGYYDRILPDGQPNRVFRSLWFRTYRYVQLEITTKEEPLTIQDFFGIATGYPFEEKASFTSSDNSLKPIWDVSMRTAKLCAHETYFDCPYYEQQQYSGDTRIQALVSLYTFGDDLLVRNAIEQFNNSLSSDGLTKSCYPCSGVQYIPPFSLFWINMVHDYWMLRPDSAFVGTFIRNIDDVLNWHEQYVDSSGMLYKMPWWKFVDWATEWPWDNKLGIGGQPAGWDGYSSILTLQYAHTLMIAAELFEKYNKKNLASHYRQLAEKIKNATFKKCWDAEKGMFADSPNKKEFSQHANIWAILTDAISKDKQVALMEKILDEPNIIQGTFFYRFYLTRALMKVGMGDRYLSLLPPWNNMLNMGLTTFAENPEPTRSDCHAWSASPAYEFLATVCGIQSSEPGFKKVRIEPQLGTLQWAEGKIPHPQGDIEVKIKRLPQNKLAAEIILPGTLTGEFISKDQKVRLKSGYQKLVL